MKHTGTLIGCCAQMNGCPTLGRIAVNSPFVLENLKRLREAE